MVCQHSVCHFGGTVTCFVHDPWSCWLVAYTKFCQIPIFLNVNRNSSHTQPLCRDSFRRTNPHNWRCMHIRCNVLLGIALILTWSTLNCTDVQLFYWIYYNVYSQDLLVLTSNEWHDRTVPPFFFDECPCMQSVIDY